MMAKAMKGTAAICFLLTILFAALHLTGFQWATTFAITFGTCFYHFAMRLAVGAVVPKMLLHPGAANGLPKGPLSRSFTKPCGSSSGKTICRPTTRLPSPYRKTPWSKSLITAVCLKRYTRSSFCSALSPCYLQFGGALSRCFASPLSSPQQSIAALPSCSDITAPDWFVFSQKRRRKPNE